MPLWSATSSLYAPSGNALASRLLREPDRDAAVVFGSALDPYKVSWLIPHQLRLLEDCRMHPRNSRTRPDTTCVVEENLISGRHQACQTFNSLHSQPNKNLANVDNPSLWEQILGYLSDVVWNKAFYSTRLQATLAAATPPPAAIKAPIGPPTASPATAISIATANTHSSKSDSEPG